MRRRLYPIPDSSRVAWCFLVLKSEKIREERRITGWELAIGNSDQIIETIKREESENIDEEKILAELMAELGQHQDSKPELYTFSNEALELLRIRLVTIAYDPLSLRGYRHIAVRDLLDYFGAWWSDVLLTLGDEVAFDKCTTVTYGKVVSTKDLWEFRQQAGSLLPPDALIGKPL